MEVLVRDGYNMTLLSSVHNKVYVRLCLLPMADASCQQRHKSTPIAASKSPRFMQSFTFTQLEQSEFCGKCAQIGARRFA